MPLSEEEQRQFEQLERALAADDPKFVSAMRGTALRGRYKKRAVLAGLGFVVGLCILMAGAILRQTVLGVVGFVVMVALLYLLAVSVRRVGHTEAQPAAGAGEQSPAAGASDPTGVVPLRRPRQTRKPRRQPERNTDPGSSGGSFMERMEHRWRRRREEGY